MSVHPDTPAGPDGPETPRTPRTPDAAGRPDTRRLVTVVCTANICRSPMGQAFLREHLADLGATGIDVVSAGTHGSNGGPAMPEAVSAVESLGGSLAGHRSRRLDHELVGESDLLLCAASEHRFAILKWWPELDPAKVALFNEAIVDEADKDVEDPYGYDLAVFMLAARVIDRAMASWAKSLAKRWPETVADGA